MESPPPSPPRENVSTFSDYSSDDDYPDRLPSSPQRTAPNSPNLSRTTSRDDPGSRRSSRGPPIRTDSNLSLYMRDLRRPSVPGDTSPVLSRSGSGVNLTNVPSRSSVHRGSGSPSKKKGDPDKSTTTRKEPPPRPKRDDKDSLSEEERNRLDVESKPAVKNAKRRLGLEFFSMSKHERIYGSGRRSQIYGFHVAAGGW